MLIMMSMFSGFIIYFLMLGLAAYIYTSLTVMLTAQRLKVKNSWLAWIPIANLVLLANMAKMHWWPVLLLAAFWIPVVNFIAIIILVVFTFVWMWKICERRHRPGWWVLLMLIPFFVISFKRLLAQVETQCPHPDTHIDKKRQS